MKLVDTSGRDMKEFLKILVNTFKQAARTRTLGNCVQTEEFRKGYHPRNKLAEDKIMICLQICPVFGVSGRITCQFFNVCGVSDIRHSGEHTAEPLMSKSSAYEVEMAI
jgi:hypothetical protein